ncbi:hypothetical protein [Pseudomonas panipatensis]|uniref:Glycosyltransferase n=1 Tax=Pseudomonas panipatensis TaxID=428992 RepID=A0A1G8DQF7_9PSED|nr:hypothetical protein [Pseudomonas panipatensis]SDH59898.1 hypothetical protein SAMN05216272_102102 [Pseudomonas panipatensis]SMP40203.1 hypothetical protein SAMN06295951_101389 [Pseudomonas panipatensis]
MKIRTSVLLLLLTLCVPPLASFAADTRGSADSAQSQALTTRLALRDLWLEHIFWIRNYAQANQAGDSRQAAVASEQVVSNATTIANSLAPLYGQPAADQLLKLLAGHWGAVKHYSDASVAKSAAGRKAAVAELTSNAAALAKFLAAANPYLPENDLLAMLGTHGAQHIAQIDQLAAHDYAAEAKTWQAMRAHILMLADTLGAALVKQFPDKF